MSEAWKTIETAPKTGEQVLLDIGYPWPVLACWNACDSAWTYTEMQINMVNGEYNDPYFENESEKCENVKGWMPLPEVNRDLSNIAESTAQTSS